MTTEEKYRHLKVELDGINFRIASSILDDADFGQVEFSYIGQRFVNQIDIYANSSSAKMETFHLTRNPLVFGEWNMRAVEGTHVSITLDDDGKIYYQAEGMNRKVSHDQFVVLYIDNFPDIIIDFIRNWENGEI